MAYFIDTAIIFMIAWILLEWLLSISAYQSTISEEWAKWIEELTIALRYGGMSCLYYAWMESSGIQATPGKMICRLRVTRKDGIRLSFGRALARVGFRLAHFYILSISGYLIGSALGHWVFSHFYSSSYGYYNGDPSETATGILIGIISAVTGLFVGSILGYLPALFTARRQTLHDLMAGTVVVKAD